MLRLLLKRGRKARWTKRWMRERDTILQTLQRRHVREATVASF
jgi:hypothetical protein